MNWLRALVDEAGSPWILGGIVAAFLLLATLVNRYARDRRRVLARVVAWLLLYVAAAAATAVARPLGGAALVGFLAGAAALFRAWCAVAIASIAVFDLVLPLLRIGVASIVGDLVAGAGYFLVTGAVLSQAGLDLGSALAASTVAAAILTISLQGTLGNVVGGVALQLEGSVRVGDWVQLEGGRQGRVAEVRWRHTTIETRDGDTIVMPNAVMLATPFTVLGRHGERAVPHRMWVWFMVDFRHSPTEVCAAVRPALTGSPIPNVAADPPPDVVCMDLGRENRDSYALYAVRYRIVDIAVDDPTSAAVRARVYAALRRAGIPLARPSHTEFRIAQDDDAERDQAEQRHARGVAALRAVPLFAPLTDGELDHLAGHLVFAPFDAGEVMTRQGAVAHWLYIVQSGTVDLVTEAGGAVHHIERVDAPGVFGEMGMMTGEPRRTTVIAVSPVVCYRLDKAGFTEILADRPALADAMSALLAHRERQLREATEEPDDDAEAREHFDQQRILGRIREFFGLER